MKSLSEVQCSLMTEWKEYKISDIGTVVTGNTPPKKDPENYGGELVWIKPPDLDRKMFVSESEETISDIGKKKVRLLPKGSVLVSCIGNIGKLAISKCELCTNQQINSIIPNNEIVDSVFLYYAIKRMRPYLENIASSAVVPLLNKNDFSKVKIILPPLETQKKIVEILEKAEKLKEWRAEADELADEFLKSVFLDMFGDSVKNPNNWTITKMGDVIDILTDYHANGSYKILKEHVTLLNKPDYALMVRTTDLENSNFTENVNYIDKSAYEFLKKSKVFGGEIIINKIGSAGNVYLMPKLDKYVSLGMNQFMIRLNDKANNIFIYYLLKSKYGETIIQNKVKGAVTKTITKDAVKNLRIPLPPIELQNQFAEIVKQVETLKNHQKQSAQQIDNLFDVLMQKAFKGELTC